MKLPSPQPTRFLHAGERLFSGWFYVPNTPQIATDSDRHHLRRTASYYGEYSCQAEARSCGRSRRALARLRIGAGPRSRRARRSPPVRRPRAVSASSGASVAFARSSARAKNAPASSPSPRSARYSAASRDDRLRDAPRRDLAREPPERDLAVPDPAADEHEVLRHGSAAELPRAALQADRREVVLAAAVRATRDVHRHLGPRPAGRAARARSSTSRAMPRVRVTARRHTSAPGQATTSAALPAPSRPSPAAASRAKSAGTSAVGTQRSTTGRRSRSGPRRPRTRATGPRGPRAAPRSRRPAGARR